MKHNFKIFTMLTVGVMALMLTPRANATLQLQLTNGSTTLTVVDGDSNDTCGLADCITYNPSTGFGNYFISVTTVFSNTSVNPLMHLNSIQSAGIANPGQLTIASTNTGFTLPSPQFLFLVGGTSGLGSTTFNAYGGNSNTAFDTSHLIASLPFSTSPFSGSAVGSGNTVNPYSLTIEAIIAGIGPRFGTVSFDAELDSVPEPATMTLLGTVMLFAGTALRRKFRASA